MAASEDNDVASRQLGWLRKVREAVNLTGPPPPEVLRCLAPPSEDDVSQEEGKTASSEREGPEPISPVSPKVVEELASLRWELQERQRTVSSLEELVDLLQTRCRELEDESRELVDLAASKHEQEQLEAGVPHERRDEDDYIANLETIKERQLSREPIPPLGRSSIRSNLSSERDLERLKLRCEELEEERMRLEMQLEESKAQGSSLAATLKQSGINVAAGNDSDSEDAEIEEREDLVARCLRLEAEKEKLQKHVERLWQMCEALDASAKPEQQQLQGRQGSLEELNFEAVVERAVSMKATERQQLARAEAEKAELQELTEALTAQVQALQERLRSDDQEVSIGTVARCEDLTRQNAELEKELGELSTAYAEFQGKLNAQKRLRLEAEEALQMEREALEEARRALEDRGVQSEPKEVAEREAEPEGSLEALRQELAALAAERDQLRSKVLSRVPKAVETQLQHAEAAVEEQMQRVTQAEAVAEEQTQLRFQAEAELEEQALLNRRLKASLEEETQLRSKAEAQLAEQIQFRSQAEASLDAERLAREEVLRRSMETSRASTTTQEELQKQAEALAIETEKCRALEQQNAGLQEEIARLVESQRTLEATNAIKLEGLQEKYDELQARQAPAEQAERSASLEKEVASLRKQIEEMVSEQAMSEELLGTDTVEELKADIVKLTEEQSRLEAECERRTAQKEELVLQVEEALKAEAQKTEELKEMQQKLRGAEEAKEEVDGKAASLRQQLQCAQAEGDMLSNELQKLGQQLQDAQAKAASLQDEYDLLRGRYETLEADHTDLGLRAEEALAGHQALTAEHQRVVDQAKHLQQRHSAEDEGLRQSHQLLSAEIVQVKAERDMLQKQVKQQEAYTESRQANLMADADRLRDETLARAEEWKSMVAELSGLRNSRSALETRCNSLMDKAREAEEECQKHKGIAEGSRAESEALKSELQLQKSVVLEASSKQQVTAEEAERLRREASEMEASRRALQREVEEYRRQGETWQMEQGMLEADASRLFAANEALMKENQELLARVQALAPKASSEEAYMARISEAEQWVLYHAGMPLEGNSMPYLSGVVISLQDFFTPLAPLVLASSPEQLRSAAAAIQSGELARMSLQCFRLCDSERRGSLSWEAEEVSDLVDAVFQRRGLPAPTKDLQRLIFMQFDKEFSGRLSAQDCLCLVDALFRALLISPAALSARVAGAPEGPIVTGRGPRTSTGQKEARQLAESIAQARLQSRLQEAERAAERAVATVGTVGPAGPVAGFLPEPIAAPFSDASAAGLEGMRLSSLGPSVTGAIPRTEMPNVKKLDPGRIRQGRKIDH